MNGEKKKRYTISVGLNDKDEKVQKIQTEKIVRLVTHCCKGYGMAFPPICRRAAMSTITANMCWKRACVWCLLTRTNNWWRRSARISAPF